jgi:dGTP triphosphohydrolase
MEAQLARLETATTALQTGETKIMASIDDLTTAVAAETTLEGSIITLLDGVQAQLVAAGLDATKVNAVFDKVTANNTALQAAITANTPVAPAPPAPPAAPGS